MRLAESCYRLARIDQGLGYLQKLQNSIVPKRIYTIYLQQGKFKDLQKQFIFAAELYEKALQVYDEDVTIENMDMSVRGSILFRLGWALVRTQAKEKIQRGIVVLLEADKNMTDSADLKLRIG